MTAEDLVFRNNPSLDRRLQHLSVGTFDEDTKSLDDNFAENEKNLASPQNSTEFSRNSILRHHELTPVTRNVSYIDTFPSVNAISPDDSYNLGTTVLLPPMNTSNNMGGTLPMRNLNLPACPNIQSGGEKPKSFLNLSAMENEQDDTENDFGQAVQFPSRESFDSFSSLQHLTQQTRDRHRNPLKSTQNGSIFSQYQPSRHNLTDIGGIDSTGLSNILIQKDRDSDSVGRFSIPSIRMANKVRGGSITTFETEEDDLIKDDESWSTLESSSLNISHHSWEPSLIPGLESTPSKKQQPVVIVEGGELFSSDEVHKVEGDLSVHAVNNDKKQQMFERDQAAYEWLRTMEGDSTNIAEAASSKFLTRKTRPFARQQSSPADVN